MHTETSAHPEVNTNHHAAVTSDPEVPQDINADPHFLPKVPDDNEVPVIGPRDELNT